VSLFKYALHLETKCTLDLPFIVNWVLSFIFYPASFWGKRSHYKGVSVPIR